MGQKVNPIGFRTGIMLGWKSRWYASKKEYAELLLEDHKIRKYVNEKYKFAGIPKIEIERTRDEVKVILHVARPGLILATAVAAALEGLVIAALVLDYVGAGDLLPAADTQGDLRVAGARLADLVEAVAAEAPGIPVDLYAHSQGGLVTRLALDRLAERGVPLDRLGLVATLASPHLGADLATTLEMLSEPASTGRPAVTAARRAAATCCWRPCSPARG